VSDFFTEDKKEQMPGDWKQWVDQQGAAAENMDQSTKDTYFGVSAGSEAGEPQTLAAVVDIPEGEGEGTATA
jgi:hypothetical protein